MFSFILTCVFVIWSLERSDGAPELLQNPGFENGTNHWNIGGFTAVAQTAVVHGGHSALKCSGRTQTWQGPSQDVVVKPGGQYAFSSFFKLAADVPGVSSQSVAIKIHFKFKDTGEDNFFQITNRPRIKAADGWVQLGADFLVPTREHTVSSLYLEGPSPSAEFYFDDATLTELPENPNWKTEADHRIETLRKSNIHFNVNVASNFNVNDLKLQIDHTKHLFGFGTQLRSDYIVSPDYKQLQNIIYYLFNWATIEEYKWTYNRGTREHPDFTMAVAATDELRKHGLNVRGHCMFWAVGGATQPSYVTAMSGQTLKDTVVEHIRYMTGITKGKLSHWDVNNELLHGNFYESKTGDDHYTQHMFRTVHSLDPTPKLFLNDYSVVANGEYTLAYLSQIQQFKAANVGLGGVGVQSHMPSNTKPSPTALKHRLDILAQAGVPMWATEMDMVVHDENSRADWYEIIWRVFFSHPGVDGIIFWGIWDHDKSPDYGLLHGYSYTLDKAGQRFVHLTKNEWSTHVNRSLSSGTSFNIRGFQGDYDVIVWYKEKPIKKQTFHLGKTDQTVTVDISGDGHEIHLPAKIDPFATVPVTHESTSTGLYTTGHATSTSTSHQLSCTTRWSAASAVGDDKTTEVGCNDGEILTGCSSILKNNDWVRDGEKMAVTNGKPVCQAINGAGSHIGTQAVARCCSLSGLTCTYKSAGPAGIGVDDQLVIPCASDGYPLGCAATSWLSTFDGTIFTNTSCIAQNDEPRPTVYGSAACCKGGNIKCSTLVSAPSGHNVGDKASIKCPSGQVMTGCNVFTENAKAAGAYIEAQNGADTCIAVNGYPRFGPEKGVQAYITCCHV
ncbi:uncharacterized protein LOC106075843 [Biomphalaria glabrata]|uniref:Uncharacterized protein LOC106075843 n=1 Tax=Biomphalaria glabrata TaxID=6526 RepID=A0A9W2ZMS9_BIOGL|nr:uncharacterized protein LOC106075843 [Biomphalaria glabrata]